MWMTRSKSSPSMSLPETALAADIANATVDELLEADRRAK